MRITPCRYSSQIRSSILKIYSPYFDGLIIFIVGLLKHLGFPIEKAKRGRWVDVARKLGVKDIDREAEKRISKEISPIFFLTHFPLEDYEEFKTTNPFWNWSGTKLERKHCPGYQKKESCDECFSKCGNNHPCIKECLKTCVT